jgi:uncharacterized protein YaaQ
MKSQNVRKDGLSPLQRRAVAALVTSKTQRAAAASLGIAERTLARWLIDANFQLALSQAEGELIAGATRRLLGLQDAAIDALEAIFNDTEASHSVKVRAIALAIDALLRLRELASVEKRLAELERTVQDGS